eukprot:530972-Pyramimonas_sp.AAC.1
MLVALVNDSCFYQQLPTQALLNCIFLQSKNEESGRPLALTSGLCRLVAELFRSDLSEWDSAKAGFWDQALRGHDPLRAAVLSEMAAEI